MRMSFRDEAYMVHELTRRSSYFGRVCSTKPACPQRGAPCKITSFTSVRIFLLRKNIASQKKLRRKSCIQTKTASQKVATQQLHLLAAQTSCGARSCDANARGANKLRRKSCIPKYCVATSCDAKVAFAYGANIFRREKGCDAKNLATQQSFDATVAPACGGKILRTCFTTTICLNRFCNNDLS